MSMKNSERCAFIGVDVRPEVKRTLMALLQNTPHPDDPNRSHSISRYVSDLIETDLKKMGFDFSDVEGAG